MNSRKRVEAAINHTIPDRVPIDYAANEGIDRRLKEHFGLAVNDNEGLLTALKVDFRNLHLPYTGPRLHPEIKDRHVDKISGIRTRYIDHGQGGGYWDYCDFPLQNATMDDVEKWPLPSPDDFDYSAITKACEKFSDYAVVYGGAGLCDIINCTGMLRNMETVMIDLITDDPVFIRFTERRMENDLEITRRALQAGKGLITLMCIGDDLGTQSGPMISLDVYRARLKPWHKRFADLAKSFNIPVMIHSCGSSSWVFNDFIDSGISVIDTLQPEALDMAPAHLKKTYGDRLAFHGCISTAGPVSFGTPESTSEDARQVLKTMMPGGGYCFSPTHMLQDNSPVENVVAMYEAALTFGKY